MSRYLALVRMTDRQLENIIRERGRETGTEDLVEAWFRTEHPDHLGMVNFILEQER